VAVFLATIGIVIAVRRSASQAYSTSSLDWKRMYSSAHIIDITSTVRCFVKQSIRGCTAHNMPY